MTCLGPDLSVRRRRLEYCWATFTFGMWAGQGGGRGGARSGDPDGAGHRNWRSSPLEEEWPRSDAFPDLGNHRLGADVELDMITGQRPNSVGCQDLSSDGM